MESVRRAAAVVALLLICSVASATSLKLCFERVTNNAGDAGAVDQLGEQLKLDVYDAGGGWIGFRAINKNVAGAIGSFIADMYWDDDASVLDFTSFQLPSDWGTPAAPGDLPGKGAASPPFSADFSSDANPPPAGNGIHPGDSATFKIAVNAGAGKTYADVVDAMKAGDLRVGMHVQGVDMGAGGYSEGFVSVRCGGAAASRFLSLDRWPFSGWD